MELLDKAMAVAVKVDGQVDAFQVTNKFIAVSVVSEDGLLSNKFVSEDSPGCGADGVLEAVRCGFDNIGWKWAVGKSKICGVTTDGESANTGIREG